MECAHCLETSEKLRIAEERLQEMQERCWWVLVDWWVSCLQELDDWDCPLGKGRQPLDNQRVKFQTCHEMPEGEDVSLLPRASR